MDQVDLAHTIRRAQGNDARAYERLLSTYGPRLYSYFFRATGSHHDSEDLLGEMMLKLVRMLKQYDDRGRFEPWLFRVASNMVRDRIRRRRASPTTGAQRAEGLEDLPARAHAVEHGLVAAETACGLKEALERLDPATKDMILLRHYGEMSFKEIAQAYDCPLGTVLARVHRGLKALRGLLGEDYGYEQAG